MTSRLRVSLAVAVAALMGATLAAAQTAFVPPTNHSMTLKHVRVSVVDATHVVVSADAAGDVPGLFTLDVTSNGTGWDGRWVLTSSYVRDVDPNGVPLAAPPDEDHAHDGTGTSVSHERDHDHAGAPHVDRSEAVHNGAVSGAVTAAELAQGDGGIITGLSSTVTVSAGSITFAGATGSGTIAFSDLQDAAHAAGVLSLFF
jgi:hypothetical protein